MSYVVEPLLHERRIEVIAGLQDHRYTRWGGSIRVSKGQPNAGSFVAHMREVGPQNGLNEGVKRLLSMENVAAAASVINVGVSVVGFAVMAAKLNRLQRDMNTVLAKLDSNQTELVGHLEEVKASLVELKLLALEGNELLRAALDEVRMARRELLDGYLARIFVELEALERGTPSGASVEHALRTFRDARAWAHLGIDGYVPGRQASHQWFHLLAKYRAWCLSANAEIHALRRLDDLDGAARAARTAAEVSRGWATSWRDVLVPANEVGGTHRFFHSGFATLPRETIVRLGRLQLGTLGEDPVPAAQLESSAEVARGNFSRAWFEQQLALAPVLDFAEEATERLESMAHELEWCRERRLGYEQWEALPAPTAQGLAMVVTGAAR